MEPSSSKDLEINDWEWLSMFYQSAREVGEIVVDDFATIKRRMIDKNEEELKTDCSSNSWVVRNVVKNFTQSITKSVENLGDLKMNIIKGLKIRYPNLEGDWLSENCIENSVSSSVKSPDNLDSGHIKNGDVPEEREQGSGKIDPRVAEEVIKQSAKSEKDKSHVSDTQPNQTRSAIQTRAALLGSQNGGESMIIDSESDNDNEDGFKGNQNKGNHEKTKQTQVTIPPRAITPPVGQTQNENVIIDSESENENDMNMNENQDNRRKVKQNQSTIPPRTITPPVIQDQGENVIINSESESENENDLKRNENQNKNRRKAKQTQSTIPPKGITSVGQTQGGEENGISDSVCNNDIGSKTKKNLRGVESSPSPFEPIVSESEDSSTSFALLANDTDNPEHEVLSDPNQIIPASPPSSQEMETTIQVHDDGNDDDLNSDSTVPTEGVKEYPVLDLDLEDEVDENMLMSKQINVSVSEICLGDQKPSSSAPKSESTVKPKRRTVDKESIRAKKHVLMSDSSDEEDFKQTPRRKPIKSSKEKSKENENDKNLSKKKNKTTPSPRSKKHVTSSDENEAENAERSKKTKDVTKIRRSKKKVDPDYWKNHDIKDDEKLQNPDQTKVVLEKLDKVMEEELESHGVVRIATLSESESEMADKRITRALRNFDKFDPLVKADEKNQKRSSKNENRELKNRKCKGENKYSLDSVTGSEDESSDDSDRITALKAPRIAKDIFSNNDSSASDNFAGSGTDNETAKKNVLDDSEDEAVENKVKKEKKENTEKCDKDSKEKKKSYYVPAVCRLSSSDDEDKKRVSKKRKPKESAKSRKFSEGDSSDEFLPHRKRTLRGKKKVSSGTEDISDSSDDSESSDSSSKKKTKRRGQRQKSSSSEEETTKKKKRKRIRVADSDDSDNKKQNDSDSDIQEVDVDKQESGSPSKGRKKIRKVMSKKELEETTREAEKEEDERKRRVLEKQKLVIFNSQHDAPESDVIDSLVLDFDSKSKETLVAADPSVVCKLKPHQAKGIKFIYDCTIESTQQIQKGNAGGGCIIAHCMGLGKTLTTITFVHAALTHKVLNFKTVLIICPLNTVTNWYNELRSWLSDVDQRVNVHKLWDQKNNKDRANALAYFMRRGGVGIIHYDLFRRLADLSGQKKINEKLKEQIRENLLDPGADIIVCDEGHVLKNDKSKLSIAVNKIKSRRRIVLTGTPLQNNLAEYHTMMSFVKPNLLGTLKEFQNRFINPIKNGQHADSQDYDVKLMKKRAHVLHKLLDGCVQRLDYTVLVPYLPPKHEYVVMVKITPKQVELYKHYLENLMSRTSVLDRHKSLLKNYAYLLKIWTHPIILTRIGRKKGDGEDTGSEDSDGSMKDFIVDRSESSSRSSDSDSDIDWVSEHNKKIKKKKADEKPKEEPAVAPDVELDETPQELPPDWYLKFFESKEEMMDPLLGGKFAVLMEILKICESIGDKLLVFSQYLSSLNLIEEFLQNWDNESRENERKSSISFPANLGLSIGRWRKNIEYYRIDGSTKTDVRQDQCDKFNNKHTTRAKLFLISTKAGGLGINLVGANRVVIFDASWNPSHDMQSIYRVYRFGQLKPCYIYRLLAQGTMEEKIYNRQVVKLSLSGRVVDEHQIERHFKFEETNSLYLYEDPDEKVDRPIPPVPKDRLLADLLISQKDRITTYLEHDSLLVNRVDEGLTDEERKAAWEEYNYEKEHRGMQQQGNANDGSTFYKIWSILQQRYPTTPPDRIKQWSDTILAKINELQLNLNYYNLHQHSLTPDEEKIRKNSIEGLRNWISQALGTNAGNAPAPQPSHAHNVPRMQMQAGVAQYPPASSSRPQLTRPVLPPPLRNYPEVQMLPQVDISSNILRQHMVRPPAPVVPPQISQGMQEAISKVGGPSRWNAQ